MYKFMFLTIFVVIFNDGISATSVPIPDPPKPTRCPIDTPMPNLDKAKMEGFWYITHVTSDLPVIVRPTPPVCQVYKFTRKGAGFDLLESSYDFSFANKYTVVPEGVIPSQDLDKQEIMLTVVKTDYEKIAAIITCSQGFTHYRVGKVLSRTPTISKESLDKIRSKLAEHGFASETLNEVPQKNCPGLDEFKA